MGALKNCRSQGGQLPLSRVDWTRVLVVELSVLVGLVLLYLAGIVVQHTAHFLLLLASAVVIAFLVAPAVGWIERYVPHRLLASALVYVVLILAGGIGIALLAAPLVREASDFARELPTHFDQATVLAADVERLASDWGIAIDLVTLARQAAQQLQTGGSIVLGATVGVAVSITSILADVALALVLSFYLTLHSPQLRDRAVSLIPSPYLPSMLRVESSVRRIFGGFLRGQLVLGVFIGVLAGVGSAFLGLPYPVVLGVLAGVFELVPMFGSLLGAIPAVILALFQPFPTVLWVLLFFIAINQVENYVLAPRITGQSIGLSPLAALVALLLGVDLLGFLGAVIAVPIAAVIMDLTSPAPTVLEEGSDPDPQEGGPVSQLGPRPVEEESRTSSSPQT